MTGIVFQEQFKEWLSSAPADGVPIDTVEIFHPKWGPIYLARWRTPVTAKLETGVFVSFQAADFIIEQIPIEEGTGQTIKALINGLDGALYEQIKGLTVAERQTPILVTYRLYLNTLLQFPLINPPPILEVSLAEADKDKVSLELSPSALPNILSGKYYLIKDFPGLSEV